MATIEAARGMGRWYRRQGVRRDLAVQYAVTLHPELAGLENHIRRGWNAERAGR
jgi:hypothetical protein